MAAPVVETQVKRAPVLSISQTRKSLVKTKRKPLRNLLVKPYDDHWPELTPKEEECISKLFQRLLEEENDIVNMKLEEKESRASKRKRWSETLASGINDVPRCVKKGSVIAVLVAADVDPKFLVQHVITLCAVTAIPVLIVSSLRTFTKKLLGFSSITIGIKKIVAESETNSLHEIYGLVKKMAEHHKPPTAIRQFAEAAYKSLPDPDASTSHKAKKPQKTTHASEQSSAVTPASNVYLYRTSKQCRTFVPKSQKIETSDIPKVISEPKLKLEDFVSLGTDSDDSMECAEPTGGISHSMLNLSKKRKQHSPPAYVPFKYMKVQPNPNKKH